MKQVRYGHLFLAMSLARVATAQSSNAGATPSAARIVTPAEDARGLKLYPEIGMNTDDGTQRVPVDRLDDALHQRARTWVNTLQSAEVTGIQHDAMGVLYIAAGQNALAQQQFTARLATPALSLADRAYTLYLATATFGEDAKDTARMTIARRYLATLDTLSLPASLLDIKFHAHMAIGTSYYYNGDGRNAVIHIRKAFALVPMIPFERRPLSGIESGFGLLADVLSGQENGRSQIDSTGAWMLANLQASPALIAKDSLYSLWSQDMQRNFKAVLQRTWYLGRQAPAVAAQCWLNTTRPATQSAIPGVAAKTLNDGVIRVIEFGHMGCPGCQEALPKMDQMQKKAPHNVETWYVGSEIDNWGTAPCQLDACVEHYKHYYVERKHLGLPMALWIGPRVADPDGGTQQQESPTVQALAVRTQPMFIVTDGHGIVRHIEIGMSELLLNRTVQYLIAEANTPR